MTEPLKLTTPAKLYADGVRDGMRISLELFLGEHAAEGGEPCPQPLPLAAWTWAQTALQRVKADG